MACAGVKGLGGGGAVSEHLGKEVGLGGVVLRREAPTIGTSEDEATSFKCLQSLTEPGVVDAQLLPQSRSADGLKATTKVVAYRLGKGWCGGVVAVDEEPQGLAVTCDEAQQHRIGCGG